MCTCLQLDSTCRLVPGAHPSIVRTEAAQLPKAVVAEERSDTMSVHRACSLSRLRRHCTFTVSWTLARPAVGRRTRTLFDLPIVMIVQPLLMQVGCLSLIFSSTRGRFFAFKAGLALNGEDREGSHRLVFGHSVRKAKGRADRRPRVQSQLSAASTCRASLRRC